jgi:hypothetical protein
MLCNDAFYRRGVRSNFLVSVNSTSSDGENGCFWRCPSDIIIILEMAAARRIVMSRNDNGFGVIFFLHAGVLRDMNSDSNREGKLR